MFDETPEAYDWPSDDAGHDLDATAATQANVIPENTFTRGGVSTAWIEAGMPQIMVDLARLTVAWMPTVTLTN